jgi:hypothetical protein
MPKILSLDSFLYDVRQRGYLVGLPLRFVNYFLRKIDMKKRILLCITFFILWFSGLVYGDDLESDELCGEAIAGTNPCLYVDKINIYVTGRLIEKDDYTYVKDYITEWVLKEGRLFESFKIKAKNRSDVGSAWSNRPGKKDGNIEVVFHLEKSKDKRSIVVVFYTFSRYASMMYVDQCDFNDRTKECLKYNVENFLNGKIVSSVLKYRN